jgi:RNA polymerase sigma-70 factor (ECF subfamily)
LVEDENRKRLLCALAKLNPKYRNTVFLRYYEGKSLKEIAAIMSCSEGVVKNRLFRSLRKLKSISASCPESIKF